MARESAVSGVSDPLSGLSGPSLFPRTFKASAGFPVPSDSKDLASIHSLMKSLELRSPEKLMNEAKRIVHGGAELLKSNLSCFLEIVGTNDAADAKGRDKSKERRPALGLVRKRAPFSLKTTISQPTVICQNIVNLDSIDDPDEYFDAYERIEKANKEIQKQLGGSVNKFSHYKSSNNERRRRPGILGKTYTYKHRFPKDPSENDATMMSSQEISDADIPRTQEENSRTVAAEDTLRSPKYCSEKINGSWRVAGEDIPGPPADRNHDSDIEEVERAGSMKKTENEYSDILQEVLTFNYEDLRHGGLSLLQERLNIKPLDIENLGMTKRLDIERRTSISTAPESYLKSGRNSLVADSARKYMNRKPTMEHEKLPVPVNFVTSPTPPRSPFASISLLIKKNLQLSPIRDPFLPTHGELYNSPNALASQPEEILSGQVDAPDDLGMSNELESNVDAINMEPLVFNVDTQEDLRNIDSLPKPLVAENAGLQNAHNVSRTRPFEEPGNDFDTIMNVAENESNPFVIGERARDGTPTGQQANPQQLEAHQAKLRRRRKLAGEKRVGKIHPLRKSLADAGTSFESGVRRSKRVKMRALEYWKGERFLYGRVDDSLKLIGVKYISPGKDGMNLKVKPYISSESSELRELLEL